MGGNRTTTDAASRAIPWAIDTRESTFGFREPRDADSYLDHFVIVGLARAVDRVALAVLIDEHGQGQGVVPKHGVVCLGDGLDVPRELRELAMGDVGDARRVEVEGHAEHLTSTTDDGGGETGRKR